MNQQDIELITQVAHDSALTVLQEPTSVVPLVRDSRYCHKHVPLEDQMLSQDGELRDPEPIKAATMHLAQEMIREGVREFMPLELPKGDVLAYRVDGERVSVRVCSMYVLVPTDGKPPGFRLRVDIAGLKLCAKSAV